MRGVVPCLAQAAPVQLGQRAHVGQRLHRQGEPRVAETGGAFDGRLRRAPDVDRRVRLLDAGWVERQVTELEELALVLEVAGRPRGAEDLDRLVEPPTTPPERRPVGLELIRSVARAEAEDGTTSGDLVQRGDLFADRDRVVQRTEEDTGPQPQPFRAGGDRRQEDERRRRILGLRRERVVTDEATGEPDRFDMAGELVRAPERVPLAGVLEARQREAELDRPAHVCTIDSWADDLLKQIAHRALGHERASLRAS